MATHQGTTSTSARPDVFAPPPGRTRGLGVPFRQANLPVVGAGLATTAAGAVNAGGTSGTPSKVIATHQGVQDDQVVTSAGLWFELVHLLPKSKIEFGNIITQVESEYEIYNASRDGSVTEQGITNNASPGVALPNNTPPVVLQKQSSFLDPTSTTQTVSGLGTLVKLKVQALSDGLPTFDTSIDFDFIAPANDVQLLVSGTRIVLIPFEYEVDLPETLAFLTNVLPSRSGKTQRISTRKNPRQRFDPTYILDGNSRRRMQALLLDWMDNTFGFPLWHEYLSLTAGVSAGATQYQVSGADDVDMRVGGLAVVIQDEFVFDVINVQAVTSTLITAGDPSINAYAEGTKIMPLRTARISRPVRASRPPVGIQRFQVQFEVDDNNTGAIQGDTTPGFWSILDGRVLFDDCNVLDADLTEEYSRQLTVLDNETGLPHQASRWDRGKRAHQKGFVLRNRAEVVQFRRLMSALGGRQKSFWMPTFDDDLNVVADLTSGTNTMDVESHGYVRFVRDRLPMSKFRVTFTDGTSLVKDVSSSATVSATVERLTLADNWPANRTVAEIQRVEYYELLTFATDEIRMLHPRTGLALAFVPVERVFDLNT